MSANDPLSSAIGVAEDGDVTVARALLEEHGADAPIVAARCISERLRDGDEAALAAWRRVLKAIYALQAK